MGSIADPGGMRQQQSKRTQGLLNSVSFINVLIKSFAEIRALDAGKQA